MDYKEKKQVLPLGSVVLLKEAKRYLVICGYAMVTEGKAKIWDYMGCAYPVGIVSNETTLMFDEEQIDKVVFEGFTDEEGEKFREKVYASIGDEE